MTIDLETQLLIVKTSKDALKNFRESLSTLMPCLAVLGVQKEILDTSSQQLLDGFYSVIPILEFIGVSLEHYNWQLSRKERINAELLLEDIKRIAETTNKIDDMMLAFADREQLKVSSLYS